MTKKQEQLAGSSIYVAGHTGLVGNALMRRLQREGCRRILTRDYAELDLRNQQAVNQFFEAERPQYVFLVAAKVGGIYANSRYPASFIYDNLMIEANVIDVAYRYGVHKLLFLGSSCMYPRDCQQPIKEEYLMSGPLEQTNRPYAISKIAGIELCTAYNRQYGTNYIVGIPTNVYGPFDSFDLEHSHVLPALVRKCYEAKRDSRSSFSVWGTGMPRREFLYVDDVADASVFLMKQYEGNEPVNIGTGIDVSIAELVELIKEAVGYTGAITFDTNKPDGTYRKRLNVERLHALGWSALTSLREGISKTVAWYEAYETKGKRGAYAERVP